MDEAEANPRLLSWRGHLPLLVLIACHAVVALDLWHSGSPAGTWQFECAVGALGWDLAHGLNPHYALSDYYDSWTSGYLITGFVEAPLMALPWRPALAVKATALLIQAGTVGLVWLFLWRNVGPWAARVGAAALTFCPPLLWFYSLHAGDYHYTELVWAFGAACLVGEVVRTGRGGRWYLALGLVCGLSITNSFGSAAHVAVCLGLALALAPGARTPARLAQVVGGALVGAAPLLYKLLLHRPFEHLAGAGSYDLPYTSGQWSPWLLKMKLTTLPAGFAHHLGFGDGLRRLVEPDVGVGVGYAWTWLAAGGLVLVLVLARRQGLRLLLPLSLLGWLLAFCATTTMLVPRPIELDEFLDARFLPPVVGLLAANLGVAAQALLDARPKRSTGVLIASLVTPVLTACALSWGGLFPPVDLAQDGIPYRGRCYDMLGLYASRHVDGLPAAGGERVCDGFDPEARRDCFRGRVMGEATRHIDHVALRRVEPSTFEPPQELVQGCDALDDTWRRDCYRHAGWTLNWAALHHRNRRGVENMVGFCSAFGEREAGWCLEGVGYMLAGHYAPLPWKLPGLLPKDREAARHAMRGFGVQLAHAYAQPAAAEALCGSLELDDALRGACVEGVGAGFAVFAAPSTDQAAAPERPDVVLVVVDTLRADRTSCLDPQLETTPRLAELGRRGVVYRQAVAPSSWTQPSIASLFTGLPIKALHFDTFAGMPTLADAFAAAGYRTVGRVANPVLTAEAGFGRGFGVWDVAVTGPETREWAAEEVVDRALADLDDPDGRPLFLYVHLMDPHEPYSPPAGQPVVERPGWSDGSLIEREGGWAAELGGEELACLRDLRARYDAEVAAIDAAIGRLLEGLDLRRPGPRLVAVTSDHGEGLYGHARAKPRGRPGARHCDRLMPDRYRAHGEQRYEEAVRVPLWLAGPGVPIGRVEDRQVEMVRVAGTLLELAGVAGDRPGLPLSAADPASPSVAGADKAGWFLRTEELKLLAPYPGGGEPALFALDGAGWSDELEDLSAARPEDRARLEAELADWRMEAGPRGATRPGPGSREPLRSLGYVE